MNVEEYIAAARREIVRRGARAAHLDPDYFAEPGWNILLDLYISEVEGRRDIQTKQMVLASCAPYTTALRVLNLLEEAGEIARIPSETDGRVVHVALTSAGRARLEAALGAMIRAEERIASPHRAAIFAAEGSPVRVESVIRPVPWPSPS